MIVKPKPPEISRIQIYRPLRPNGKLVKSLNSYEIKITMRYVHRIPVYNVDLVKPILMPGTYIINYDSKTIIVEVLPETTNQLQ